MISKYELVKFEEFYHMFTFEPNFRVISRMAGMRFIIHSNENCGHNRGHIHIEFNGAEMEIDLLSFEVINVSGKIANHKVKMAQEFVKENQKTFIEHWNEFCNGIKIPIPENC